MGIVNTTIYVGPQEADGRYNVIETHTDHQGATYTNDYYTDDIAQSALNTIAQEHRAQWEIDLRIAEFNLIERQLLEGVNPFPEPPTGFQFVTRQEALDEMFNRLMSRPVVDVVPAAGFLDYVSDAELEAAGFSDQQIAGIRVRVTEIKSLANTLQAPAFTA